MTKIKWMLASLFALTMNGAIVSEFVRRIFVGTYSSGAKWGFAITSIAFIVIAVVILLRTVNVLQKSGYGIPVWVGELERNKTYICRYAFRTPNDDNGPHFRWIACVAENCKNPEERVWKLCCFYEKPGIGEFQLVTGEKGYSEIKFLT